MEEPNALTTKVGRYQCIMKMPINLTKQTWEKIATSRNVLVGDFLQCPIIVWCNRVRTRNRNNNRNGWVCLCVWVRGVNLPAEPLLQPLFPIHPPKQRWIFLPKLNIFTHTLKKALHKNPEKHESRVEILLHKGSNISARIQRKGFSAQSQKKNH